MSDATRRFFEGLKTVNETASQEFSGGREFWAGLHIGSGHASAMLLRAGAKELAQILTAFPESVRPVEEPGLWGT